MTKLLTVICFVSLSLHCFSQTKKIDSLNNLISRASSDTQRLNYLNAKARLVGEVNLDSAIAIFLTVIDQSQKIGYSKAEAEARYRLAGKYCFKGMFEEAHQNLVTAEKILSVLNDSTGIANCKKLYGTYYSIQNRYDSGIYYNKEAIQIAERHQLNDLIKDCCNNIGNAYMMQSDFSNALLYFQKGLRVAEKDNDTNSQSYLLLNIGITYKSLNDNVAAEKNLLKTIRLAQKDNSVVVELYACSNIASVYSIMGQNNLGYSYAIKAVELAEKAGDNGMIATNLSRAAHELARSGKFDEADSLVKRALLAAVNAPEYNISQVNSDIGAIKTMQGKFGEAIPYFEKAFAIMKNSAVYDSPSRDAYNKLSLCYEKTGDYKKALVAFKVATAISDSIKSRENIRKSTELRMNYNFEKQQQVAKAEQDKKEAKTKRTRNLLFSAIGLFLLLTTFLFINNRLKQRAKQKIENAYAQLKATQQQLIQSEKMASLGELTAGIAHEIQNPLNFVNNFSEVSNELIDEMNVELNKGDIEEVKAISADIKQNLEKINHHGKRADAIVKGMLQHSRSSSGTKESTDINALCDEYLRLAYHGLRAKDKSFNAKFETDFDDSIGKITIVPQEIGRVILNLINNAFYAVSEKQKAERLMPNAESYEPTVTISTKKTDSKISIAVTDNGNGIPQKILEKIFQPFFTTKPTGQGTGLGLSLAY
ncbi:MAG: tetratricopeptide repeat protein, partial [Bacteroidetes bacterium]|nr:tetratricopeptide repeat protein [Bacteroidota bacterium]